MSQLSAAAICELVARYDRPGPRYTSYPAVPAWSDSFGADAYARKLGELDAAAALHRAAPLSIYVHLPFCKQRCLYCGCNVVISKKPEITTPYLAALKAEVDLVAARIGGARRVTQLHLGGGTPTYLEPHELRELGQRLKGTFDFAADAECSVEVDPRVTSDAHLAVLRELGFDRLSMGVQDLDPAVQEAIGRVQPEDETRAFFSRCRSAGFSSINVDLIYGLPLQTTSSFARTIASVAAWSPDRVALFSYAHVPHMRPHQAKMPASALPPATTKMGLYVDAVARFEEAGYRWIGLDHFAKPKDELARAHAAGTLRRNFMGFTTKPETEVLAFGLSAISDVGHAYAQNDPHLPSYRRRIEAGQLATTRGVALSPDDLLRRDVIMSLLCNGHVDKQKVASRHAIDFDHRFAPELQALGALADDGLIDLTPAALYVTRKGRWVLRNICMVFDAHLQAPEVKASALRPQFSRTI